MTTKSPRTMWVVEHGEYSDYRVVGIYSSEKNAKIIADKMGDGATIAEWNVDPLISQLSKGYRAFLVIMLRDGDTESVRESDSGYGFIYDESYFIWMRTKAEAYRNKNIPDALNATVYARNEKHAIKIANEWRIKAIATGEWK